MDSEGTGGRQPKYVFCFVFGVGVGVGGGGELPLWGRGGHLLWCHLIIVKCNIVM